MLADSEFQRRLEEMLDKEFQDKAESLTHRLGHSDYHYRCGYIAALREVGEMCRQVVRSLHGGRSE